MKKVFISQPMSGKTREEILKTRNNAIKLIKRFDKDIEVIDNIFTDYPEETSPLYLLGKSLELMSMADMVFFTKGWRRSRGCQIEHDCALRYGPFDIAYDYTSEE